MKGPFFDWQDKIARGDIIRDHAQMPVVQKLQTLYETLNQTPLYAGKKSFFGRLFSSKNKEQRPGPKGLYIYGGVGCGKSMLMDSFFAHVNIKGKQRVHFHAFMIAIQKSIHQWRQSQLGKPTKKPQIDPLPEIAGDIAQNIRLLCFDEFHVTDIADAMILERFFTALFDLGVVVVATSNWPPDMLYKDGLQRARFLPFIDVLKARMEVIHLDSSVDYRRLKEVKGCYTPLGEESDTHLQEAFTRLSGQEKPQNHSLMVRGRTLDIPGAHGIAFVDFDLLCARPLGAEDYLILAKTFHGFILNRVPVFNEELRNEAKRFMILIDALYEHHCQLIIAAAAPVGDLYHAGIYKFEFERTLSRISEMHTDTYRQRPHIT